MLMVTTSEWNNPAAREQIITHLNMKMHGEDVIQTTNNFLVGGESRSGTQN